MVIEGLIWLPEIVDKLELKHHVATFEVEDLLNGKPLFKKIGKGRVKDEDLMEDVDFDVNIERRIFLVPVSDTVFGAVRRKAKNQGLSTETMVNLLLQEHAG